MALWGDKRYVELLERENADLKDQVKKLTDSILQIKGASPVFHESKKHVARTRLSIHALGKRLEQATKVS
jgi:hypothetical protein